MNVVHGPWNMEFSPRGLDWTNVHAITAPLQSPNKDNYLEKFIVQNLSSSSLVALVGGEFDWMSAGGREGGKSGRPKSLFTYRLLLIAELIFIHIGILPIFNVIGQ